MRVYIQNSRGTAHNYKFDVEPSTTVLELKKRFCQNTNSQDLYVLCLVLNGEELEEDKKTLSDYNILDECQFDAVYLGGTYRALGGIGTRFVNITNGEAFERLEWSLSDKPYWKTLRGLCLEGICTNPACEANGQYVIMRIGYKKFDIVCDPDEHTTVCSMCEKFVEPVTVALNNCWWGYEGIRLAERGTGKPSVQCSSDWQKADDTYYGFSDTKTGTVVWTKLILEAVSNKPV